MAKTNDCIAYCDSRQIVPIIPCRYVISDDLILTAPEDLPDELLPPAGIGNSPHHQLASIRQGYLYIYGKLSIDERDVTDQKAHWLIFRYQTRADDGNSCEEPTACATTFQYYNYTWKNGTARSEWIAHPMESEPYAYVNLAAMDTYIAYSQERWPAYMFEEIERNPSWRDRVMQPLTLHEEDGTDPHVMKLDNLHTLVEDYKSEKPENREDANTLRHTSIGDLDITPFLRMKNSENEHIQQRYEYARIVALQDTLGEAKDLLRVLEIEEANIQNYEAEHHYAMVTAKAIASVDKLENAINKRYVDPGIQLWNNIFYATRKVFSTDPFNRSADALRHKLATYGPEQRKKYKRLVEYWKTLDQRPGVHEPARLALQGAEQKRCEQCIGFAASQLGAYVDGVRLNAFTPAAVYNKLKLNPDDTQGNDWDNSEWAILFAGVTKVASESVNDLTDPIVINRIQQTFFDVYTEVSTTLFEGNSQIQKTHLERLIGVTEGKVRIPTSELNNQMHQYYDRFLIGESSTLTASTDGQGPHGRNSGLQQSTHRYGTIDIYTYDHITDTPVGKVSTGLSGIAMVLALFSAQQTIQGWHHTHNFDARSKAGAIANLPAVQLSLAFSTVVSNHATLRAEPTYIRMAQQATRLATRFAAYAISGVTGKNYILPQKANTAGISSAKLLERAKYARLLGGLALVTGLLVSAGQGAEGYKREDYALMTGHALQGVGSLVMSASLIGGILTTFSSGTLVMLGTKLVAFGVPGAIIGGVMIALGLLFTASSRTGLEQWIYEGFWGSSDSYWGKDRSKLFEAQLSESLELNQSKDSSLNTFFEIEMRAFEKLVWPIIAEQLEDSLVVNVEFEGLTDKNQLAQLSINLENYQPRGAHGMMTGASTWARIQSHQINREWVGPGVATLDLSAYADEKRLRLTVSFDRLMPDGEAQRFTMIQPLEITAT